ncbi:MAG: DMT family transporter [Opitutaceae bacterium]|nr:DMT family transporter [Opitutaceae bacterium]
MKHLKASSGILTTITLLLWASAFSGIRVALEDYSPEHLGLLRYGIASIATLFLCFFWRPQFPKLKDWPHFFLTGLIIVPVYTISINYAEQTISAGSTSFIISLVPVITGFFAPIILKEAPEKGTWIGLAFCIPGIALISFGEGDSFTFSIGVAWGCLSALSGATTILLQKSLLKTYDGYTVSAWTMWTGTFFMLFFLPGLKTSIGQASLSSTLSVIYLGIFPGAIAYITFAMAMKNLSAARISRFLFLIPILSLIVAFFWLREIPTTLTLAGGGITLAGVILSQRKPTKRSRQPS